MADTGHAPSFSEFLELVEHHHRETSRRARRRLIILGVLVLAVLGYASWLYSQLAKYDADAVADIARGYVVTNLPQAKETLRTTLIDNAPEVTDQAQKLVVQLPRFFREQVEGALPPSSQALAKRFEEDISLHMDTVVQSLVTMVETEGPVKKEERLKRLVHDARAAYRGLLLSVIDRAYADYATQVRELDRNLSHLQRGRWLSQKEELQKEVIEATLVLLERHGLNNVVTPDTIRSMGFAP